MFGEFSHQILPIKLNPSPLGAFPTKIGQIRTELRPSVYQSFYDTSLASRAFPVYLFAPWRKTRLKFHD
ncbi:MAG: hypothetical protein CMO60_12585 [Verrucomicrobiales bacterium]|nr:hypothetical protein [Verrucomicrobiales bacterium]